MSADSTPGFFSRFLLAWVASFRVLFDARFARDVGLLRDGALALPSGETPAPAKVEPAKVEPAKVEPAKKPEPARPRDSFVASPSTSALQLLAIFQREGRFLDFLEEDVAAFSDAQIGAAARVVHEGCRKAMREHVPLTPVRSESEGDKVTIEKGFDASRVRLTGHVTGEPPFRGTLAHRGWKAGDVKLPKLAEGHDATVLAPAEVEL